MRASARMSLQLREPRARNGAHQRAGRQASHTTRTLEWSEWKRPPSGVTKEGAPYTSYILHPILSGVTKEAWKIGRGHYGATLQPKDARSAHVITWTTMGEPFRVAGTGYLTNPVLASTTLRNNPLLPLPGYSGASRGPAHL